MLGKRGSILKESSTGVGSVYNDVGPPLVRVLSCHALVHQSALAATGVRGGVARRALYVFTLVGLLLPIFLPAPARAIVLVSGSITADTTWAPPEDYLVIGDVIVEDGVTLTILAGTRVLFQTDPSNEAFPRWRLEVQGSLRVLGTAPEPVLFTSDHAQPTRGDWASIRFVGSEASVLEHARIHYATTGLDIRDSSPYVNNTEILESVLAGVEVRGAGSRPRFEGGEITAETFLVGNGTFTPNERIGIVVWEGRPEFRRMAIHDNAVGVLLQPNTFSLLEGCEIREGWNGLQAVNATVTLRDNRILRNGFPGFGGTGLALVSHSGAAMSGNLLEDNGWGVFIDHGSGASVRGATDNWVNGIPLEDIYYVDRHDEVVTGQVFDSGHSDGFRGNVSYLGHVTLYDSTNVTFEGVSLLDSFQSVWAENSTFRFANSTIRDSTVNVSFRDADIFLRDSSLGVFADVQFNRSSVRIDDARSLLRVDNFVRAEVLSDLGVPLAGAEVTLDLEGIVQATARTDASGRTGWLEGSQGSYFRPVAAPDTVFITANAVLRAGLPSDPAAAFKDSPRAIALEAPATEVFVLRDTSAPTLTILPADGATDVALGSPVKLQFSEPMDTASVEAAVSVSGSAPTNFVWSEGNRTLTFDIETMEAGRTYLVRVSSGATDLAGNRVPSTTVTITVGRSGQGFDWTPVAIVAAVVLGFGILLVALGRRSTARDASREQERDDRQGPDRKGGA